MPSFDNLVSFIVVTGLDRDARTAAEELGIVIDIDDEVALEELVAEHVAAAATATS